MFTKILLIKRKTSYYIQQDEGLREDLISMSCHLLEEQRESC